MSHASIIPVILSGGAGSRLWPLSRQAHPKQLLPLLSDMTMVQETVARFSDPVFADPVFICNELHVDAIRSQLRLMGRQAGALILEPVGRNTAPCAVVAAEYAKALGKGQTVLLAAADHHVQKPENFVEAVKTAATAAINGHIVTFGITPDRPETGYGYIEQGELISDGIYAVKSFREKPDSETARIYIERQSFCWNAGLFLFSPDSFLAEASQFVPEIKTHSEQALEKANVVGNIIQLDPGSFAACQSESIDYAIMEHTQKAAIVPVDMGWNDIGSYAALRDSSPQDEQNNAIKGDVILQDVKNSLIQAGNKKVSVIGLNNIGVIVNGDEVLVLNLDQSQDVKKIVNQLKSSGQLGRL